MAKVVTFADLGGHIVENWGRSMPSGTPSQISETIRKMKTPDKILCVLAFMAKYQQSEAELSAIATSHGFVRSLPPVIEQAAREYPTGVAIAEKAYRDGVSSRATRLLTKLHLDNFVEIEVLATVRREAWTSQPGYGLGTVHELARWAAQYGVALQLPDGIHAPPVWTKRPTDDHDGDGGSRAGGEPPPGENGP